MSEPSKKPPKPTPNKPRKPPPVDLPDDDAIKRLFPKRVVDRVNDEIGHKPAEKPPRKPE